jgi:hypothetical protein
MSEVCNKSYLFLPTLTAKTLSCTYYEITTKKGLYHRNIAATPVPHAVKDFVIMV